MLHLDVVIHTEFNNKRWAMAAKVYARPLELFESMQLSADEFAKELNMLGYRDITKHNQKNDYRHGYHNIKENYKLEQKAEQGTFSRKGEIFEVTTRDFPFWDINEQSRKVRLVFAGNILVDLLSLDGKENPDLLRLDPPEIAGIYPAHHYEDRILLQGKKLPSILVDTLLAVEDRAFFEHAGVNPKGIIRAMVANLRAGRTVQGGSTLTQQLVKSMFLGNEKSFKRKFNEALMAILIDAHYGKYDILEAYANTIYLGQDGKRAIHGFGLASQFYFGVPLEALNIHQIALLVGLVKGPSYFEPRRHPDRAKERRAVVLEIMTTQNIISAHTALIANNMELDLSNKISSSITAYPAFIDLVQHQLQQYYKPEDLISEGLRIFTTIDLRVQKVAEDAISKGLSTLEMSQPKAKYLQGASIVIDTASGEVLALVGDREAKSVGFNRVLAAKRPVGSLLKPIVYLTALEQPHRYTLASLISDSPLSYSESGRVWNPSNYDRRYHGRVTLLDALSSSYNIPAVKVGFDINVMNIINMLKRLGFERDLKPYPSLLLGGVSMSLFEITQIYESIASGGFKIPLRAIREVTDTTGQPLKHYTLHVEKAVDPGPAYLITYAMQQAVSVGTASTMKTKLPPDLKIAGKTGTTNDYRDSWFIGFSSNKLSVVWVGRDDNKPISLSGSTGALRIWMDLMSRLNLEPLDIPPPISIENIWVNPHNGLRLRTSCQGGQLIPFIIGSGPSQETTCIRNLFEDTNTSKNSREKVDEIRTFFQKLVE